MILNGFIKLHRQLKEWEWYKDTNTKSLFIHCLLSANFKESKWQGILIKRGQFATSLQHLADESGLSVRNIRTSIEKLEKTGELATQPTSKFTVITVCKFDFYQSIEDIDRHATDKQPTNNRQTTDTLPTNDRQQLNNDNKENNDNNDKEKESEKSGSPSFENSEIEVLQKQLTELSQQLLSLKTEKEKEKSSAKKEKEKIGDTPLVTPPHKTDIEQPILKPYQVTIQDFDFSIFPESLRNAFFSFCESMYEKSKGKFSGTQAKELIRVVKIDINKAGVEKVEKCLQLCTLSGWNYDINYQLNKELREKQDEIKRNKQHDDPTISTVESAVRARFGENIFDDRHKNGYNPLPMPWETEQEF